MKLKQLKLINFRQYLDEHVINFADDSKNVTLIRGANGFGKTGIFRAIMFCLYGDRSLDQDNLSPLAAKEGLVLVNQKLLNDNPGKPMKAAVEITFTHAGEQYTLKREIQGCETADGSIVQEEGEVQLQVRSSSGDTEPTTKEREKIQGRINQVLPSRLRDFFLFDGERMEKLTRPGDDQKKEIQRGIRALLQLDVLDQAINALKKQETKITKQIQNNSTADLEAVTEQKIALDIDLANLENDLEEAKENVEIVEKEISQIETKLTENQESIQLQEQRRQLKDDIASKENILDEKVKDLRSVVMNFAPALAIEPIAELLAELDGKMERGELPSDIKQEFIEGLLQNQLCICGTHLAEGSAERQRLDDYKKRNTTTGQEELMKLFGKLGRLQQIGTDKARNFDEILLSRSSLKEEIEGLQKSLLRKEEELGDFGDINVQKLMTSMQQLRRDKENYASKIGVLETKIIDKREQGNRLDQKIADLSQKNEIAKEYNCQRQAIQKAISSLRQVSNRYTGVVRERLADLATEAFRSMGSSETLESLARIVITDDFHLEVENALGRPMLSQISSGQRQIVSLAYICALIESCGNLEMPLFMDTPLGRLSGAHRDGCLGFIPSKTSQWVMLGTDTEIQEEEASALRNSGKLGKVYEIEAVQPLESEIKEQHVPTWQPVRARGKIGAAI